MLALYLGAVADFLVRRTRLPRPIAFWLGVVITLGAGFGLVALLVPPVAQQTQQLINLVPQSVSSLSGAIQRLATNYPGLAKQIATTQTELLGGLSSQLSGLVNEVLPRVFSALATITAVFTVIVMGIDLALDPAVYREWVIALFPPGHRDLVRDVLIEMALRLRDYIVAQLWTMLILGALTAIGLWAIHVPYWLTFGVLAAAAAIIPVYGVLLSTTVPALFVIGGPNGLSKAALVIGLGVLIHVIEGNVVSPNLMSKRVDLPPVLTMMAVLIFGTLLGPIGLLVSVPLLVAIMVLVHRLLVARIYEGRGFRRPRRDRPLVLRVPAAEGGVGGATVDGNGPDLIALGEAAHRT